MIIALLLLIVLATAGTGVYIRWDASQDPQRELQILKTLRRHQREMHSGDVAEELDTIPQNLVYSLLHGLYNAGLLNRRAEPYGEPDEEGNRPNRYLYSLTPAGEARLQQHETEAAA